MRWREASDVAVTLLRLLDSCSSQLLGVERLQGMQSIDFGLMFGYLLPKL